MTNSYRTGEFREPRGRRETRRVQDVKAIIHSIVDFHTTEVLPTQSSHYRVPGAVGNVLLPEQLRLRYDQPEEGVGYTDAPTQTGFDINGNFDVMYGRLNAPDDVS